jgi:hypothetical protein
MLIASARAAPATKNRFIISSHACLSALASRSGFAQAADLGQTICLTISPYASCGTRVNGSGGDYANCTSAPQKDA